MRTQMRMHKSWQLALSLVWLAGCTIHTTTGPAHPKRDDDSAQVAKHKKKKHKKADSAQASTTAPAAAPATPAAPAATPAEPSAVAPVAPDTAAPAAEDEQARKQREREEKLAAEKAEADRKRAERKAEKERKKQEQEAKAAAEKEEAARKREERIAETERKKKEREAEKEAQKKAREERIADQAEKDKPALSPAAQIAAETGKPTADRTEVVKPVDGKTPDDDATAAGRKRRILEKPHRVPGQAESDPHKKAVRAALSRSQADKVESLAGKQSERAPGSTTADKVEGNPEAENVETLKKK